MLENDIEFKFMYAEVDKVELSASENQYIYLKDIFYNNNVITSYAKVSSRNIKNIKAGDYIKFIGSLYAPSKPLLPYGFNFYKNSFYKRIGANGYSVGNIEIIRHKHTDSKINFLFLLVNKIKENIIRNTNAIADSTISPFLLASSIGVYSFLPQEELQDLRRSSLVHLISISGYHISIIAISIFMIVRIALTMFPKISLNHNTKQLAAWIAIIPLSLYSLLVWEHLPALRAIIMCFSFLLLIAVRINPISLHSILLAALIILTVNPYSLYSASFLLSFFASLTAISIWKNKYIIKYKNYFKDSGVIKTLFYYITRIALITFVIQIAITPIIGFFFKEIPLYGVLANIIVVPIFSLIVLPFMLAFIITPLFIGKYFLYVAEVGMSKIIQISHFFANLKQSTLHLEFFPAYILAIYLLGMFLLLVFAKNKHLSLASVVIILISYISYYSYTRKDASVIITYDMSVVAIKENEKYYTNKEKISSFISNYLFGTTPYKKIPTPSLYVTQIDSIKIAYMESLEHFYEACGEANLIIINKLAPYTCKSTLVIDSNYMLNSGSLILQINNSNINVITNN